MNIQKYIQKICVTFICVTFVVVIMSAVVANAQNPNPKDWQSVVSQAKGQTVYWNAWGGGQNINDYISWVGDTLKKRHGVEVVHVKLDDTAHAVATVLAEKVANKNEGGTVDLIWINGENFAAMKRQGLLFSPGWANHLPNWKYVDVENKPIVLDFTIPTDGLEAPWGGAKLVFFYDSARTKNNELPDSANELLNWAKNNPGKLSYPAPPDFIGSSFLKQVLSEVTSQPKKLLEPVKPEEFDAITKPLFDYLDQLHPVAWRKAQTFPKNFYDMQQKLGDKELDIIFAFNPATASNAIAQQQLPNTVRSFTFSGGTLGNSHYVAIPYNANAKEGALILADFLMSPEAQIRKQDPNVWGDPTILNPEKLPKDDRDKLSALELGIATLPPDKLGPMLPEPHPTWMQEIEKEWTRRYAN